MQNWLNTKKKLNLCTIIETESTESEETLNRMKSEFLEQSLLE
jgi:hypothetical protein